jgi:hypothetical protein
VAGPPRAAKTAGVSIPERGVRVIGVVGIEPNVGDHPRLEDRAKQLAIEHLVAKARRPPWLSSADREVVERAAEPAF